MEKRITVRDLQKLKQAGEKILCVTAYDALFGKIADDAGMHLILVGDSMGTTVLGYDTTLPVTLEESYMLTKAVRRGAKHAMIVGDMPFLSYQCGEDEAVRNAGCYLKECGADAVKLEGGAAVKNIIRRLVQTGIPVMAHIGLLPQSVLRDGGYRSHGKSAEEAEQLLKDAIAVQEAGAFAVVLECVPAVLAKTITERLTIPTVGIGAGPDCDGEIQVISDILGMGGAYLPRHAKRFASLAQIATDALKQYAEEARKRTFPGTENYIP